VSRKIALLQNGQRYAALLEAQAKLPSAASASARVLEVTMQGPTRATVHYTILLGGKPALGNQTGTAVLQGGTWKVSDASFCALLSLENGGKAAPGCPG
jgi:hypothetical protein